MRFPLQRGRALAEKMMTDTCVATRTDGTVWDETEGREVPRIVTVYSGKCRVKPPTNIAAEDSSELLRVEAQHIVSVPAASDALLPDDRIEVTASEFDAELAGMVFTVKSQFMASQVTARRYRCEAVTGRGA